MPATQVVLKVLVRDAFRLPPTPDTNYDNDISSEEYQKYADEYKAASEWCGANLYDGVDSRDVYYYYLQRGEFFASDDYWIVRNTGGTFSAYTDEEAEAIFTELNQ
jgi:hypothetical protein